jgi:hypothetical protein
MIEFWAIIKIRAINPYLEVPRRKAEALKSGWRKPMPVLVQLNGRPKEPWRINLMPRGDGSFYLYLHEKARSASGTRLGQKVRVGLSFDARYRGGPAHPMPAWFRVSLSRNKRAKAAWDALPPSRKKEILRYFSWLKSEQARERNVTRALEVLSGRSARFMARDWRNGK